MIWGFLYFGVKKERPLGRKIRHDELPRFVTLRALNLLGRFQPKDRPHPISSSPSLHESTTIRFSPQDRTGIVFLARKKDSLSSRQCTAGSTNVSFEIRAAGWVHDAGCVQISADEDPTVNVAKEERSLFRPKVTTQHSRPALIEWTYDKPLLFPPTIREPTPKVSPSFYQTKEKRKRHAFSPSFKSLSLPPHSHIHSTSPSI